MIRISRVIRSEGDPIIGSEPDGSVTITMSLPRWILVLAVIVTLMATLAAEFGARRPIERAEESRSQV